MAEEMNAGRRALPKSWLIIGAVVLVVAIIGAGAWWQYRTRETAQEVAPGQTLYTAQEGNIVDGFPKEFILEDDPEVLASYRIEYQEGNVNQPFARYISKKTFAENVELFKKHFADKGWQVNREGNAAENPATFFYARKDKNEVNVIIRQEEGRVEVAISYVSVP